MTRFEAVAIAQAMVYEDRKKFRDEGTCVLGAGIYFSDEPCKDKWYRPKIHIHAPFQGNVGSYNACVRAMNYLKSQGFPAEWHDGSMD